jgi:hypothetical protein
MSAMYHLKAIAEIVQHYYPETLHRLFIVNAPSAFVVMFKVIKPWLNPRVSISPMQLRYFNIDFKSRR